MTTAPEQATVVVGVEGAASSRAAIRLAAREARYRDAPLVAVMAYSSNPALGAPAGRPLSSLHTVEDERFVAASVLHDAVVDALGDQAGQVELRTVLGQAGRNLVEVARKVNAQLIVLGSRSGASTLLGSVSQYVLRKAPCPILVVPEAGTGTPGAQQDLFTGRRIHMDTQTVVVTGASAGIGRATARLFGQRGARVALIARGQAGLDGAARDVEEAGGQALAISADVADYDQVTAAARQAEERLGPIDVWVNVAFTSVFAPFSDITAEEFRRVTEVSYLGFVHGTMAALALMRPRGRGTIVQVGSALGERSIPLQSAYCGAKHAINGFTSSLRCELLHENSGVRVTVVQMPAVNTPQFSWVRSRLPNHPQPVPPIYEPEVAARGVLFAADHPGRRQYWVGASTTATLLANRVVPAVLDRYLARTGYRSQQTTQKVEAGRPDNLLQPVDGTHGHDHGAHGIFDDKSHDRSPQLWLAQHARVSSGLLAGAAVPGAFLAGRRGRHR